LLQYMAIEWKKLEETNREYQGKTVYLKHYSTQRRGVIIRECPECGKDYIARIDELKRGKGSEYCSRSCSKKAEMRERNQEGKNNPNWKGGVSEDLYRYKKKQMKRNPEKIKARKKLYNALRTGKIQRKPCEICGEEETHGHHEDYDKPLDVRWLCQKHHREYHEEDYESVDDMQV